MKSQLVPGTGERASRARRASPTNQATREGRGRRNEATNRLASAEASRPGRQAAQLPTYASAPGGPLPCYLGRAEHGVWAWSPEKEFKMSQPGLNVGGGSGGCWTSPGPGLFARICIFVLSRGIFSLELIWPIATSVIERS
jgi:hypothetical protein